MNDDDLLDRLRRAAADVPPSTLDLGAVLRSARRKQHRHRAAVASGCVAAVAGVGAVAPAVPGLLPPGPVQDVAAGLLPGCPAAGVEIDWTDADLSETFRRATVLEVAADGQVRAGAEVRHDPAPRVRAAEPLPPSVVDAVLAAARAQDEAGVHRDGDLFDEVTVTSSGGPASEQMPQPFDGFVDSQEPLTEAALSGSEREPGHHVDYDLGFRHALQGRAGCDGDDLVPFTLTFEQPWAAGSVECADAVPGVLLWVLLDGMCPGGLPEWVDAEVFPDPADRTEALRQWGLAPQG